MDKVKAHFDKIAPRYDYYTKKRALHYTTLKQLLRSFILKNKKVLEVGCGTGDILVYLEPKYGYGFDISSKMIEIAKNKYKGHGNVHFSTRWPKKKFDYIFMADVIEHLSEPAKTFKQISESMAHGGYFINTMMNPVWMPVEAIYNFFRWKMPEGPHKRLKFEEIKPIVSREGMKIIGHGYKLAMPIKIPFITSFVNNYIERHLKQYAFIEYFVAEKR